jgi:hypothetical protein
MYLPFLISTVKLCIDGQVFSLIMHSRGTVGISHHKKSDVTETLFEILEVWGTGSVMEWQ